MLNKILKLIGNKDKNLLEVEPILSNPIMPKANYTYELSFLTTVMDFVINEAILQANTPSKEKWISSRKADLEEINEVIHLEDMGKIIAICNKYKEIYSNFMELLEVNNLRYKIVLALSIEVLGDIACKTLAYQSNFRYMTRRYLTHAEISSYIEILA